MSRTWWYLEQLSRFGHRGSATTAEAAAARQLKSWLEEIGLQVELQPFRSPRDTLYLGPSAVMLIALAGAAVGLRWPWAGLLVTLAALLPLVGEMLGLRIDFDLLLQRYPSQNVVARLPAGPAAQARTLVLTAHYDTQRASYLFHPRFAPFIQPYFYLVYASLLCIPIGLAARWALPVAAWPGWLLGAGSALTAGNLLFLLLCRLSGRYINGSNDNGSGVALALALAERWARDPLPGTDLRLVLTGCEEVGIRGMKAYLKTADLPKESTTFVNLDNLGDGQLHYLTGEGMLTVRPYSDRLVRLAGALAAERPDFIRPRGNLLLPTDGLAPLAGGFEAITFIAFGPDGRLPNYHWYTDRLEGCNPQFLAEVESFLFSFVRGAVHSPQA